MNEFQIKAIAKDLAIDVLKFNIMKGSGTWQSGIYLEYEYKKMRRHCLKYFEEEKELEFSNIKKIIEEERDR